MEIILKDHQDADVMGDKKPVLKIHILKTSQMIKFLNLKEIPLDLVTIHQFKKARTILSFLKAKTRIAIKKWTIL